MTKAGSDYVAEVAKFFKRLGFAAEIEKPFEGARGIHSIDVWVTGKLQSFDVRWVVECKDWKNPVPKEKVLALQSVALDVGADRGFLLSESGFQAGAIRSARLTNITLTSLMDLREQTREQFMQATIWALYVRVSQLIADLRKEPVRINLALPATGCLYMNPEIDDTKRDMERLEKALLDSMKGTLPVEYGFTPAGYAKRACTMDELIDVAYRLLGPAEQFLAVLRTKYPTKGSGSVR